MDQTFYLLIPENLFSNKEKSQWEYVSSQRQLYLLEDFYLPIYLGEITAYEYETYQRNYRKKDAETKAKDCLQEYMEKLQEKGVQILGSDGKIENSESGWQITGTLTVIEDIAMEVPSVEKSG